MYNKVILKRDNKIIQETYNTILYTGEDLIGLWLAWQDVKINKCYIEFSNESDPDIPDYDKSDAKNYYTMMETDPNRDIIRSDIIISPFISKDDNNHISNKIVFYLMPLSDTGYFGKSFTTGISKILGACLVYAKNDILSDDIIFARTYLNKPEVKTDHTYTFIWSIVIKEI